MSRVEADIEAERGQRIPEQNPRLKKLYDAYDLIRERDVEITKLKALMLEAAVALEFVADMEGRDGDLLANRLREAAKEVE